MYSLNFSSTKYLENLIRVPDAGATENQGLGETSQSQMLRSVQQTLHQSRKQITLRNDKSSLEEIRNSNSDPTRTWWVGKNFSPTRSKSLDSLANRDQGGIRGVSLTHKNWLDLIGFPSLSRLPINTTRKKVDPVPQIRDATVQEEIINALTVAGYHKIANRLNYLYEVIQESDDPDNSIMNFMSLQKLALFFTRDDVSLPDPDIGVDPEGFLQAEWHFSNVAALMKFLPDGKIVFAATSTVNGQGESQDIQGKGPGDIALKIVRSFLVNPNVWAYPILR